MKYSTLTSHDQLAVTNEIVERCMASTVFTWTNSDKPMSVRSIGRGLTLRLIMEPESEGELKGSNESLWRYFNGLFNSAENVLPRPIELMLQSALGETLRAELRKRVASALKDYDCAPATYTFTDFLSEPVEEAA